MHKQVTEEQCVQKCRGHSECIMVTYTPSRKCYLKRETASWPAYKYDPNNLIYVLPDYFTVADHGDRWGGDWAPPGESVMVKVAFLKRCAERCRKYFECDAFTYVSEKNECWTKSFTIGKNTMKPEYNGDGGQLYIRQRHKQDQWV